MGYVQTRRASSYRAPTRKRNGDALGFFVIDDALEIAAAAKGAQSIASSVSNLFHSGATTDAQRLQRANFFRDSAKLGSITAARYLFGGLQNTASHEIPYYQAAIQDVGRDELGAAALEGAALQGAKWAAGVPDPGGTQQMIDDVKRDLAALEQQAPVAPTSFGGRATTTTAGSGAIPRPSTTTRAQGLPAMQITAPFNYTPWLIGGGALVVGAVLMRRS
jgi:hypothetical protein